MAIKKQEFYEGAALHLLARTGTVASMRYNAPFFIFNDRVLGLLSSTTLRPAAPGASPSHPMSKYFCGTRHPNFSQ